ncbi:twin-arginine translocase subunit TatB [Agarivorans sp. B2Z047]|uniref:Sec-independent protein translocase protein TatB n=1 Tax=Agarivorans sp. B2Z047 TaxID=2652721 RepID=UPI00128B322A|nr:Sec-independent protein translocase protein TatB [Agarivorans sp. B2Z047]MPW30957.1 twin-arginine translocase subunit TatB [Agarivorans sp. B2Z047]UQN40817.1 Sec-independent protein translocase protein TatB [Agarivorans sp. B2Z047]
MFDVGSLEIVLIAALGLVILGPQRLPNALRTGFAWYNKAKTSMAEVSTKIEKELELGEVKDTLNQQVKVPTKISSAPLVNKDTGK